MTQQQNTRPEWTKIGSVEVCVGTDGVTGVWNGTYVYAIHPGETSPETVKTKALFEGWYCQPPAPRHIREDYEDGSVVIKSVEKGEQGRPLRVARCGSVVMAPKSGIPVSGGADG